MLALDTARLEDAAVLGRAMISRLRGAGLLILDLDLRILLVDGDAFKAHKTEDLMGSRVPEAIPPAAWAVLEPHYVAALGGAVQTFEFEAITGAATHWVRIVPLTDEDKVIGLLLVAHDITANVTDTMLLGDTQRLQRSVLMALAEGVIVIDLQGRLVEANEAACAILGFDLEVARSDLNWRESLDAHLAGDHAELDVGATVVRTGQGVRDVHIEFTPDAGPNVLVSANYEPLHDGQGTIDGLLVSFRDVTEREREHRRLIASEERLHDAHTVARLGSWEWRHETDEVVVFHGLDRDRDRDPGPVPDPMKDLLNTLSVSDRRAFETTLAHFVSGEHDEAVMRHRRESAAGPVWLETRARAVRDGEGRLLCVRGTTQDVSEYEIAKQEAATASELFQATLDSLAAHIAVLDGEGDTLLTNRAWIEFADGNGGSPTRANYLAACDAAGGDEYARRAAAGLRAILSGELDGFSLEYPCHGPDVERWFLLRAARYEGTGPARVVVAHDDVTKRHQAEAQVTTQAALLDEVDVAVVARDAGDRVTQWNRGAELLFGWPRAEVLGRVATELIALPELGTEGEVTARRKDGSTFPAYVRDRLMADGEGRPAGRIGVTVDMSERVASERALRTARNYLRAVTDSMGEGLFTLDTDGRVTYLNEAAEALLGWSAEQLHGRVMHEVAHFRRPDGSEFAIEDSPIHAARRNGETLRVEDGVFLRADGNELPVAYTAAPFETDDGVQGSVVVFNDISERKANEEALRRESAELAWIGRIRDALADHRFVLYAQPIVDLASGEVVQSELLLRMCDPDGTMVPPGAFLPVAEQYGLIGEIDRWVIEQGAELAAGGRAVEVNLSARSICDPSLMDHIQLCIARTGADPSLLVFEVTETALVEDEEAAELFATRLHGVGCKLALDDFGTGYGGFTYLKQLPLDYLKIDIEFVRDLVSNPASRHVVEAVVALARGFELQTVAEGVEDAETFELLRALGVDFAQGYHIARPAPLDDTRSHA